MATAAGPRSSSVWAERPTATWPAAGAVVGAEDDDVGLLLLGQPGQALARGRAHDDPALDGRLIEPLGAAGEQRLGLAVGAAARDRGADSTM